DDRTDRLGRVEERRLSPLVRVRHTRTRGRTVDRNRHDLRQERLYGAGRRDELQARRGAVPRVARLRRRRGEPRAGMKRGVFPALVAPVAFFGASILGGRRVRDYRHRDEPMSALAASGCEGATAMVPGFVALAASTWLLGGALTDSRLPKAIGPWMR